MALTATLGTALTAVNRPDPNSLGTKRPYTAANARAYQPPYSTIVDSGWVSQAQPALFPTGKDSVGNTKIKLHFVPTTAGATFTATYWAYNPVSNTWSKPYTGASVSYTGETIDYIDNPGNDAIFIQLSSISAGTLSIYYDPDGAIAA